MVNKDNRIVGTEYREVPIGCSDNLMPWVAKSKDYGRPTYQTHYI